MSKYMDTKTGSLEESILGVWTEAAKKQQSETNKNDKSDDGEGLDAVQPKAVKKKFDDRKDKDIDNDGDTDDSDKFLHKKRKAISKAISKDEGNAFGKALKDAKEKGEKTFVVAGKTYNVKEEVELKEIKKASIQFSLGMNSDMMKAKKDLEKKGHKVKVSGNKMTVTAKGGSDIDRELSDIRNFYDAGVKIKAENYEVGTKERTDHTLNTTPGQSTEDFDQQVGVMQGKNNYMRETLAKMWGYKEGHNPFKDKKEEKKPKTEKTMTGKKATEVKVDPDLEERKNK
jgi:hypothetical protein